MGTKDRLIGLAPDWLKPPLEADSFEGLIDLLKREKASHVEISVRSSMEKDEKEFFTEKYRDGLDYKSVTPWKRRVHFLEAIRTVSIGIDEQSKHDRLYKEAIRKPAILPIPRFIRQLDEDSVLSYFVIARQRMKKIQEGIEGIQVKIFTGAREMTQEEYDLLDGLEHRLNLLSTRSPLDRKDKLGETYAPTIEEIKRVIDSGNRSALGNVLWQLSYHLLQGMDEERNVVDLARRWRAETNSGGISQNAKDPEVIKFQEGLEAILALDAHFGHYDFWVPGVQGTRIIFSRQENNTSIKFAQGSESIRGRFEERNTA